MCQFRKSFQTGKAMDVARTVDATLEPLPADLAVQRTDAGLLVELDVDRLLVITEETCEYAWEAFVLNDGSRD